jgi:YVTN family beta-propeller protein
VTVEDSSGSYGGEVLVVDAQSLSLQATWVLPHSAAPATEVSGPGVPNYLNALVIAPDGASGFVPSKQDNILAGGLRGAGVLDFDSTVRAVTSRIDLATGAAPVTARWDHDNASVATGAAFSPDGRFLFVALETSREVGVIDLSGPSEILRIPVGRAPQSVAISADGTRLYVHNFMDRSLGIFDVTALVTAGTPSAPQLGVVPVVTNERIAPDILLGKQLFYDAADDRLARDNYLSCAGCHNDGDDDGRVWDFTDFGEGLRNTISLRGRGSAEHGRLHWSANFDEVQDFEGQIRGLAAGSGLMADADFFAGTRSEPLGDPKVGLSSDLDALAAYVASLTSTDLSPHRNADGSNTTAAIAGAPLFQSACASCHTGSELTDSATQASHDVGTLVVPDSGRPGAPLSGLDTPGVRGLFLTAPYLHNGSAQSLEEAIAAHSVAAGLTATQRAELAAHLRELDPAPAASSGPRLRHGVVSGVGSSWQRVSFGSVYADPVVVTSIAYEAGALPAVARVRSVTGQGFDLRVQNPGEAALAGYTIHYVVAEAGTYTQAEHGIAMEAVSVISATTDENNAWAGEAQSYLGSYGAPVVLGQVVTENNPEWSVFWASNGTRTSPPSATSLSVGKHVGEDPSTTRAAETLNYVVIESGTGVSQGVAFEAGLSGDTIRGLVDGGAPFAIPVSATTGTALVSSAGMDGGNGGWPVLGGSAPVAAGSLLATIDEDQLQDPERNHTTEQVGYLILTGAIVGD